MLEIPDQPGVTVSRRIGQAVRQAILSGQLVAGDKLPPRAVLAEQLHVNPTTVGHAYGRLEAVGLVKSIQGSGTYVCKAAAPKRQPAPQTTANTTSGRKLESIVLVIDKTDLTACTADSLRTITDILAGLKAAIGHCRCQIDFAPSFDRASLGHLQQGAAVLIVRDNYSDPSLLDEMKQRDIPVIQIWNSPSQLPVPMLGYDTQEAVRLACQHLYDCGYTQIGYVGNMGELMSGGKFFGFTNALFHMKMDYQVRHVREVKYFQAGAGALAALDMLEKGDLPEALVVDTDERAIEIISALTQAGLNVPEDIGIVGYNDIPEGLACKPQLTTVHLPRFEAGVRAGELLQMWLNGENSLPGGFVPLSMRIRQTTKFMKKRTPVESMSTAGE